MCSGPAQEAERDGGKTDTTASDTQRDIHGEPSQRTKSRAANTLGSRNFTRKLPRTNNTSLAKNRPVRRPTLFRTKLAVSKVGRGLLEMSPTYQFFKRLRGPKKYRDDEI